MSNGMTNQPITARRDPWVFLKQFTDARIALGHAGGSLPTDAVLEFRLAHARARDAVHRPLHAEALCARIAELGLPFHRVHSRATDRAVYLQRPDLGRQLNENDRTALHSTRTSSVGARADVAFVVGDGLSALAVEHHAADLLAVVVPTLRQQGLNIAPVVIAEQARVALGDQVGAALNAELLVMLIGERPGLSSPDSLGIYLTWAPKHGRMDSERNCISNVRPDGLSIAAAAHNLLYLITAARDKRLTGVRLKNDASPLSGNSGPAAHLPAP
ncbi:ethanolamine ammonia-lyase subunit EutC [Salinisphaera sp. RV14]|uniref:ethanolamine ammonia-lyase subunit EutC n=1 Tax=unclassified Salinisphaera TaxID=2649847 RepID=UPI003F858197